MKYVKMWLRKMAITVPIMFLVVLGFTVIVCVVGYYLDGLRMGLKDIAIIYTAVSTGMSIIFNTLFCLVDEWM